MIFPVPRCPAPIPTESTTSDAMPGSSTWAPTTTRARLRGQQRLAPAAVEMGVAAPGRPDGPDADGLPFPAGHEQMEQGGAPVVFLHLVQLARRAVARLRDGGAADRWHDDGQGLKVTCRLDHRKYPVGRKITDEEFAYVNLKPDRFHGEWNYTIHPSDKR